MEIIPFQSVGPFQLGSSRNAIHRIAKGQIKKSDVTLAGYTERSDYLVEEEVKVYFNSEDQAEAFEFFNASLSLQGKGLGKMNAKELSGYFQEKNESTSVLEDSIEVPDLGIKAIFPDKAMKLVRHYLVYQRGFFEQKVPTPDEIIEALLGGNDS